VVWRAQIRPGAVRSKASRPVAGYRVGFSSLKTNLLRTFDLHHMSVMHHYLHRSKSKRSDMVFYHSHPTRLGGLFCSFGAHKYSIVKKE
jgi:hypothetical protein